MLPLSGFLEKLVNRLVPDARQPETQSELDERLLATPPIALERCREVAADMVQVAVSALKISLSCLQEDSPQLAASVREKEEKTDYYEDILGTYLVKLSEKQVSSSDSAEAVKLLKMIGDFERVSEALKLPLGYIFSPFFCPKHLPPIGAPQCRGKLSVSMSLD